MADTPADAALYIFGGLPGTGKTTLSRRLAAHLPAVHLRIDTIEHAIREAGGTVSGGEGYNVAYKLAADNLRLGFSIVADSVNPWPLTRAAWRNVALDAGAPYFEIEVICSDPVEHRSRVETRSIDIEGFSLPTWDDVVRRDYRPWTEPHVVVDTASKTTDQCFEELLQALRRTGIGEGGR